MEKLNLYHRLQKEIQDKSPESIRGLKLNINIDNFNETDINKQSTVKTESVIPIISIGRNLDREFSMLFLNFLLII